MKELCKIKTDAIGIGFLQLKLLNIKNNNCSQLLI